VQETDGLLVVIFSREKLPWGDDPDWREALNDSQHPIAGLAEADADAWLRAVPMEDAGLRNAIIAASREEMKTSSPVYPLMLEMQVEH
jgi:hypothetical protein